MYLVLVFFRKDSMKVNMDKIRQYEGSRKKYNANRLIYHDVKSTILNAMCMFIYLFVIYFSFAPVISAIAHRYVNDFISKS